MAYVDRVEFCKTVINNVFNGTIIIILKEYFIY